MNHLSPGAPCFISLFHAHKFAVAYKVIVVNAALFYVIIIAVIFICFATALISIELIFI